MTSSPSITTSTRSARICSSQAVARSHRRRRLSGPRHAERTSFPEQRCLEARAAKLSRVAVTTFAELTAPP